MESPRGCGQPGPLPGLGGHTAVAPVGGPLGHVRVPRQQLLLPSLSLPEPDPPSQTRGPPNYVHRALKFNAATPHQPKEK